MLEDDFADIIGKARFGKGVSLAEVAREGGLSERRLNALEGGASPTDEEIGRLAAALSLDPRKLADVARASWEPKQREPIPMVRLIDGRIGNYPVNGYLFVDAERREAALFDTGYSPDQVLALLEREGARLVALCVTHTHPDHIGGGDSIHHATGAPIYVHPDEFGSGKRRPKGVVPLEERGEIPVGRFQIGYRSSPGHTPGGTTFLIEKGEGLPTPIAFVGDALFAGSLGRAESAASYSTLLQSVEKAILSLPKETRLFPGHGPATTVDEERRHNPFFH